MIAVKVLIKTDRDGEVGAVGSVVNALERAGYDVLAVQADNEVHPQIIAAEPEFGDRLRERDPDFPAPGDVIGHGTGADFTITTHHAPDSGEQCPSCRQHEVHHYDERGGYNYCSNCDWSDHPERAHGG